MRKLVLLVVVLTGCVIGRPSAASHCGAPPTWTGSETIFLVNPATNGYIYADGNTDRVYGGVSNPDRTAYFEVYAGREKAYVSGGNASAGTEGYVGTDRQCI
jgi:hypothetical protein